MHWRALPVISIVLNAIALILLIVAFSTEYWVQYDVDRATLEDIAVSDSILQDHLDTSAYYEDRHKGLFHICYTGDTFDKCVKRKGYEMGDMSSDLSSDEKDSTYMQRVHLMRACLVSLSIGILTLFLSLLFVIIGTLAKKAAFFRASCACATIACFAVALGMAVFHGVEYLEKKKLTKIPEFPAAWAVREHFSLNSNIDITFGFSMYLGWISLVFTIFIAILTMWTGVSIPVSSSNDQKSLTSGAVTDKEGSFYSSTLARNRAYDIVEGKDTGDDVDAGDFDKEIFSGDDIFIGMDKPPGKQRF